MIETSQKEVNPVFIQIAHEIQKIVESHLEKWSSDVIEFCKQDISESDFENFSQHMENVEQLLIAQKLEQDFEELYNIWVAEDDEFIPRDEAYQYVCENPPDRSI